MCEQPDALELREHHTSESLHVDMDEHHNPSTDDEEHMHDGDSEDEEYANESGSTVPRILRKGRWEEEGQEGRRKELGICAI